MILNKIFKKSVLAMTLLSTGLMTANAVELNAVDTKKSDLLESEIIHLFTDGAENKSTIENMKQVGDSQNYLFKYQENGEYYTMMYMENIKSILIQSTGEIFSLEDKNFITKDFNADFAKTLIKKLDKEEAITYSSTDTSNSKDVYVFTDPTCGFCQKLHREIKEYQDLGMNIHYFPFPRGGLKGYGYNQLVNTICSSDQKAAMKLAKSNKAMPMLDDNVTPERIQECKAVVKKYYDLGAKMGVKGTPAMFSASGTQLGGYVPANELIYLIDQDLKRNKK